MRCACRFVSAAPLGVLLFFSSPPMYADLITFSDRASFNADAPGLPVETFESGLVSIGGIACAGPLSSAVANPCFPPGALLPGVTYDAPGSLSLQPSLLLLAPDFLFLNNISKGLGPRLVGNFDLVFESANAVAFDFYAPAGRVAISVFGSSGALRDTFVLNVPLGPNFFGVIDDAASIGRVNIASGPTIPEELIDNVTFGNAAVPSAVPEPGTAALTLCGLILAGATKLCRSTSTRGGKRISFSRQSRGFEPSTPLVRIHQFR